MAEQELKPLIIQLYIELLAGLNAKKQDAYGEFEIAEGAEALSSRIIVGIKEAGEILANAFLKGIKDAGEMDELLSLSPEEIRELFNKSDFSR